jgi:hypothetical protein
MYLEIKPPIINETTEEGGVTDFFSRYSIV